MSDINSGSVFLTTLQPHTASTTYALPSDIQLGNGSAVGGEAARKRRVQEQVRMKLAEKSPLPRQSGGGQHYAMSDYGGSSTMKYSTYSPTYSSKSSFMVSGSKTMGPRVSTRKEFSSRSAAPGTAQFQRMSVGVGGGGGLYQEDMRFGGAQGSIRHVRNDQDAMSVHSLRNGAALNSWGVDHSDADSIVSERDGVFSHQYAQSSMRNPMNGFGTQVRQGGGTMSYQTQTQSQGPGPGLLSMGRSQSGTLTREGNLGGGTEIIHQQQSFRGPAHRTISRITNRNRMSVGSMHGTQMTSSGSNIGGDRMDGGDLVFPTQGSGSLANLSMQRQAPLTRSMSIKSMQSVGGGMDIYDDFEPEYKSEFEMLDMGTAVLYLTAEDEAYHAMGAAYIQHWCYKEQDSKEELRDLNGIKPLVKLFDSGNAGVRRFATGAIRNAIYQNTANKTALINANGISMLNGALSHEDDELNKNITGIIWNLSAKEDQKITVAKGILGDLIQKVIAPICKKKKTDADPFLRAEEEPTEDQAKEEIYNNATGCIRNLSSGEEKVRQVIRETKGLIGTLVTYARAALKMKKQDSKGMENTMCILRNLSYQLYDELPPSLQKSLNLIRYDENETSVGCFSPRSKAATEKMKAKKSFSFNELQKEPKDSEWLCSPLMVELYSDVIQSCEINATTREAAIGGLQNITSGDNPRSEKLSYYLTEKGKKLQILSDVLHSERPKEQVSLIGVFRNVSRHADISDAVVNLVEKLPENDEEKDKMNADMMINLLGALNNAVTNNYESARRIARSGNGLRKLLDLKRTVDHDINKNRIYASAGTVLANMYNYKKLRSDFKKLGYQRSDIK